jgi:drug/metabolite transporter (DMT)-like permease
VVVGLSNKYNIYTVLAFQNLIGLIWFIPAFFIFDLNGFVETGLVLNAFIPIFLLAVFGSTVCYLLFIYGVKKLGVTRANIFGNSIPVFTAFFAWLLMGKTFNWMNILGIALVLTGVTVTQINMFTFRKAGNAVFNKIRARKIYPKS